MNKMHRECVRLFFTNLFLLIKLTEHQHDHAALHGQRAEDQHEVQILRHRKKRFRHVAPQLCRHDQRQQGGLGRDQDRWRAKFSTFD